MNFQELGLMLQREREQKGLTIESVMESTKISRTNIVAMENGDRATLPHPVYAKGFVKSYARFLGLDAEELSMVVDNEYQDEADGPEEHIYEVSPAAEKAFQEAESPEVKRKSMLPMLLVLMLLVVIAVLLFLNLKGDDSETPSAPAVTSEQSEPEPPALPIPEVEEPAATETETEEPAAVNESGEVVTSENAEVNATEPEAAAPKVEDPTKQAQEITPEAAPVPAAEVQSEKKPEAVAETKPQKEVASRPEGQKYDHLLVIRATTDKGCWVGVWRGDEATMARDFVLKQGEPLRLMFNSPRRIRIGNAAGVSVTYNGKPYPLNDAKGNIQTLRFGME